MKEKDNWQLIFLKLFLFFTPFFIGGYHIVVSAIMSVALCMFILARTVLDDKKNKIEFSVATTTLVLISLSYLVVSLWAVDSGTAVYGFIKFLPVALFGVAVSCYSNKERLELLEVVPYSGIAMGVSSYALSFIPQCKDFFLVAERLGGFFQYPNAFAAFCLAGVVILLLKNKLTYINWLLSALLVAIIFLTGSRTVFVFLIVTSFVLMIKISEKNRIRLLALMGTAILVSAIIVIATDSVQTVGRYLTISLESSTLLGRVLYYKDAIFQILRHPFGLGYYGYYYSQGSFQSGVYSVAFVHNDALQLLLDIGWIPSAAFFAVIGKSFFSQKTSFTQKLVMFVIFGHSMFDFDLQFISVFMVLILTLDFESGVLFSLKKNDIAVFLLSVIIVISNLYFGLINSLYLMGKYELVDKIYGSDTQSEIQLMTAEKDYDTIVSYADDILSRNEYVTIAYDAKANYAFQQGSFTKVVEYKEKALDCSRYVIAEYNDFCEKLIIAMNMYKTKGDQRSVIYCQKKLLSISERLEKVKSDTSEIAWKLRDKPQLELNSEYEKYIGEIRNEKR